LHHRSIAGARSHPAEADRPEVQSAALLFSGGIKATLDAIGKSTKRAYKNGLFVT
jgi:hypothetical protein